METLCCEMQKVNFGAFAIFKLGPWISEHSFDPFFTLSSHLDLENSEMIQMVILASSSLDSLQT